MKLNSIRFKGRILFSIILLGVLVFFSAGLFIVIRQVLYSDLDASLEIKVKEIGDILEAYKQVADSEKHPLGMMGKVLNEQLGLTRRELLDQLWASERQTLNLKNDYINIFDSNGTIILSSDNISEDIKKSFENKFASSRNEIYSNFKNGKSYVAAIQMPEAFAGPGKKYFRILYWPVRLQSKADIVIQIGTPVTPVEKILRLILIFLMTGIFIIVLITGFLGDFFVRKILKPVHSVTRKANTISTEDLSSRIPVEKMDVELQDLVQAFNSMLKRLDYSFEHINEFSSHVAHELKTPLAIIRGEMELALDRDRTTGEYKRILTDNIDEVDRLIKVIKDMLLLAKLDYKQDVFKFEHFQIGDLLREVFEHCRVMASEKQIDVTYQEIPKSILINGDRVHLRRLFLNLIDNALRYTLAKGQISIVANCKDQMVHIEVSDTGEGMSKENQTKIFDKFFRAGKDDEASSHNCGLGLNICVSIARAHHGQISVSSELGKGSTFTVILPLIPGV